MAGQVIKLSDLRVQVPRTPLDQIFFNTRFGVIAGAINGLAERMDAFDVQSNTLVQVGLGRINETLGPFLTTLQEAAQAGFLVADADGVSKSLAAGVDVAFILTSAGASIFTPTPFVMALDKTDSTNWGILSLNDWDKDTLTLSLRCVYATKTQASTQWSISDQSSVIQAMLDILADTQTASTSAVAAAATATSTLSTLAALAAAIASGPVASVAGKTGVITLAISDIVGLVDALAAKASIDAMNTALAGKQASNSLLSSVAGQTITAGKMLIGSGAGTFTTITAGAFGQTLLGEVSLGAAQTALQIVPPGQPIDGNNYQIQVHHSIVHSDVPSSLIEGQLAVNEFDDLLFWRHWDGATATIRSVNLDDLAGALLKASNLSDLPDALAALVNINGAPISYWFGGGLDGDATITGALTLTRDMFYNNLTISAGAAINPNGYRIYVANNFDISAAPTGAFILNGANAAAQVAGAAGNIGSIGSGQAGVVGSTNSSPGASPSQLRANGGGNGAGGKNTGGINNGGTAVVPQQVGYTHNAPIGVDLGISASGSPIMGGQGGSSGASSGSGGTASGAGGAGGNVGIIIAKRIVRGTNTNTDIFQLMGGNGGAAPSTNSGGGGGGGGGWLFLFCQQLTGSAIANAVNLTGGNGGNGNAGAAARGGNSGQSGSLWQLNLGAQTLTRSSIAASVTTSTLTGATATTTRATI